MKPTDEEIRLAQQLEKLGLLWIPQPGDMFHDGRHHDFVRQYYKGHIEGGLCYPRSREHREEKENCTWLPSVEQVFIELGKLNCRPEVVLCAELTYYMLSPLSEGAYYKASDGLLDEKMGIGATPREALYRLLIKKMEANYDQQRN